MQVWWDGRESFNVTEDLLELEEDPDVILVKQGDDNFTQTTCFRVDDENHQLVDTKDESIVGLVVPLDNESSQERAMAALGSVEWILVDNVNNAWQMIPAENLIAAAQSSGTRVAFVVHQASDVGGLARALELGVDALCMTRTATPDLVDAIFQARSERAAASITKKEEDSPQIVTGSCWRRATQETILADRICVDLVQSLTPEEGCWVGSSAKLLALILSEAASSQFVPTRPFRINAGPVHSYILLADDTTKYLCELEAADQVAVYNAKTGTSRSVAVGRLKQEVRPCVLVELISDDLKGQVFLQQAETVRLGQEGGTYVRATDLSACLKQPDEMESVLLRVRSTGTHIGKSYSGKVEER